MAWEGIDWSCGHEGSIQMYGPGAGRRARQASEAGRKCLACWLLERWEAEGDPRKGKPELAVAIAEGKGIRISYPAPVASPPAETAPKEGEYAPTTA